MKQKPDPEYKIGMTELEWKTQHRKQQGWFYRTGSYIDRHSAWIIFWAIMILIVIPLIVWVVGSSTALHIGRRGG